MIDDDGIKRDKRPNASQIFMETLQRGLDKIMRYSEIAAMAGQPIAFHYSEHKSCRGIQLITMTRSEP